VQAVGFVDMQLLQCACALLSECAWLRLLGAGVRYRLVVHYIPQLYVLH
jgi:hypothetical protein